jgi:hypothetical protein
MNYYRIIVVFLTAYIQFFTTTCFAWGKTGHHIIADIAELIMKENVKENVQKYLDNMSFEEAADWMDEMRSEDELDYMKPWHYIDLEKGEKYVPDDGDNLIDRLTITYNELNNKDSLSPEAIHTDLLIMFHLVGDLFQPLHVGYPKDKGGNLYQISLNGRGTNLHAVWDRDIIEDENIILDDCMELYRSLSPVRISQIKKTSFIEWMYLNRKLLNQIYPIGHKIDSRYLEKNKRIVEWQLVYAGIKLDAVLEALFSTSDKRVISQPKIETISAADAMNYIAKKVKVCSEVYGVKELSSVSFLDLGANYPDNPLAIVIFSRDMGKFTLGLEIYDHKNICVTGTIKEYKGKPEIIIISPVSNTRDKNYPVF